MNWGIDDERLGSDGAHYMVLPCGSHAIRSTWAARPQACSVCGRGVADGGVGAKRPARRNLARAEELIDAALAHDEGRRLARVAIKEALGMTVEPSLRVPVYRVALVTSFAVLDGVLAALRGGTWPGSADPAELERAALLAAGVLPDDGAMEGSFLPSRNVGVS